MESDLEQVLRETSERVTKESGRFWRTFSGPSAPSTPGDQPAGGVYGSVQLPGVDKAPARLRIEVMQSREINLIVFGLYTIVAVGLLYTLGFVQAARAWWPGGHISVIVLVEKYALAICRVFSVVVAAAYIAQIFLIDSKDRLDEQIWTSVLLSAAFIAESPFAWDRFSPSHGPGERASRAAWRFVLDDAFYASVTYFFFLSVAHSLRILDSKTKRKEFFYTPKVAATLFYAVTKTLLGYYGGVRMGLVPFTRVIGLLFLESSRRHRTGVMVAVLGTSLMDMYLIAWIAKEITKTASFLGRQSYFETRTKQLGFRSFVYLNLCFGFAMLAASAILTVGMPLGYYRGVFDDPDSLVQVSPTIGTLGLAIMYEGWIVITAWLNLPAKSRHWFSTNANNDNSVSAPEFSDQRILYKHREYHTDELDRSSPLALGKNIFVMQTQIMMINCAWASYIPGNAKEERTDFNEEYYKDRRRVRLDQVMEHSSLNLCNYVCDRQTDSHMLVFESRDRIVVSFSGTRSYKNWVHNVEVFRTSWSECFPYFIGEDGSDAAQEDDREDPLLVAIAKELIHFGEEKVHSGFARVYRRLRRQLMQTLINLYDETRLIQTGMEQAAWRPIFFTGHSLGGALATLASFDAAIHYYKIGIRSSSDISVTTFGCPRVGNTAFQRLYDKTVGLHWRFVVASDVVTKMPRFTNYSHVGVQVLLDHQGNLLVDPSFIELSWWHHLHTSHKYHARYCYFLAMKLWCRRYNGGEDDLAQYFWAIPENPAARRLIRDPEAGMEMDLAS